jgi:hypothetical protein
VPGRSEAARRAGGRSRPYDLGPVVEPLTGHDTDILVTKRNWGAFHGTDLDVRLRRRGVTRIVLGGIATSLASSRPPAPPTSTATTSRSRSTP